MTAAWNQNFLGVRTAPAPGPPCPWPPDQVSECLPCPGPRCTLTIPVAPRSLQTSKHWAGEASIHLAPHWYRLGGLGSRRPGDIQRVECGPASHLKLVTGTRLIMTLAPRTKVSAFAAGCRPTHYRTPALTTSPCPSLPDGSSLCLSPDPSRHSFNKYLLSIYAINGPGQGCRGGRTRQPLALPLTVPHSSGRYRRGLRLLLCGPASTATGCVTVC